MAVLSRVLVTHLGNYPSLPRVQPYKRGDYKLKLVISLFMHRYSVKANDKAVGHDALYCVS